ncbi:MAG: hypothetical protein Q6L55_06765 [Gloeomargarita sp. SRBZ-1_bins_9]
MAVGYRWLVAGGCIAGLSFIVGFLVTRNARQAFVTSAIATTAAGASSLLVRKLGQPTSESSEPSNQLAQERESLRQAIELLGNRRRWLESQCQELETRQQSLQTDLDACHQRLQTQQQQLDALIAQEQTLQQQIQQLRQEIRHLEQQQQELVRQNAQYVQQREQLLREQDSLRQALAELEHQRQTLNRDIGNCTEQQQQLQQAIQALQQTKEALDQQVNLLASQEQQHQQQLAQIQQQLQSLQREISHLNEQRHQLVTEIAHLTQRQQTLQAEITALKQQQAEELATRQVQYREQLQRLEVQRDQPQPVPVEPESLQIAAKDEGRDEHEKSKLVGPIIAKAPKFIPLVPPQDFRLSDLDCTEWLWEEVLWPRCRKQNPVFLGSICLPLRDTHETWGTETIWRVVAQNLRDLGSNYLNYESALERYDDAQNRYWLRIITFALAEYAYYMDSGKDSGFWEGLCKQWELPNETKVHNGLREIAHKGIRLLKLPIAEDGHAIVSTLWLQSGIPRQNLNHFADAIVDLGAELNWEQIRDRDARWLSQKLLDICQARYPSRKLLERFLKYSCRADAEPIAGEIVQDIAQVALALRAHSRSPDILLDDAQRREFLVEEENIKFQFFLRDWEAVAQILTPERPGRNWLTIQRRPLTLSLDVETLDVQLTLPGQYLQHINWSPGVCCIPEAGWRGQIDASGQVMVEELTQTLYGVAEKWVWRLLDAQGKELLRWEAKGVAADFPVLMFDAQSGEYLLPTAGIRDTGEIFCFTDSRGAFPELVGVAVVETDVPCSLAGWRGQRLQLTRPLGELRFPFGKVTWKLFSADTCLRGLSLPRQKTTYLEVPVLWYYRHAQDEQLTVTIEGKESPVRVEEALPAVASGGWLSVHLETWIQQPGSYRVQLQDWSQEFDVLSQYAVTEADVPTLPTVEIWGSQGRPLQELPLRVYQSSDFWAETLTIKGLWPLELVELLLAGDDAQVPACQTRPADKQGQLVVELASLRDLLPGATCLSYRRADGLSQPLLVLAKPAGQWRDKMLLLTGLNPHLDYRLLGWNLLHPHAGYVEIPLERSPATEVSLASLHPGIYYWWLVDGQQTEIGMGWWCGYQLSDFRDPADENLADFYYSILRQDWVNRFQKVARHLNWDKDWLRQVLLSLQQGNYHFPTWLNARALMAKLQAILEPVEGLWYRVGTQPGKRGDFYQELLHKVRQEHLWHVILDYQRHPDKSQRDIALLKLSHLEAARPVLESLSSYQWLSRQPLTPQEVAELLPDETSHG